MQTFNDNSIQLFTVAGGLKPSAVTIKPASNMVKTPNQKFGAVPMQSRQSSTVVMSAGQNMGENHAMSKL